MEVFNNALANAEMAQQAKAKEKAAKKAYIADLVKQGIDKELAKVMANVEFEYGLVKAL